MPSREYQTVPIDPEDIEDGIKDARLLSLRKEGYRTVAVLPVEHKGRPRLAFVMEPPAGGEVETYRPTEPVERGGGDSGVRSSLVVAAVLVLSLGLTGILVPVLLLVLR